MTVSRKMTIYRHEDLCPNTSEEHREEQHSDWGADPGEYYCLDLVEDYCCEACSEGKDPYEYWPCPTVAALTAAMAAAQTEVQRLQYEGGVKD